MIKPHKLPLGAALLVGAITIGSGAQSLPPPTSHMLANPKPATRTHSHALLPGIQHQMPPHGFREAPPEFHGTFLHAPHPVKAPSAQSGQLGRPGRDLSTFHGHDYAHFSLAEQRLWGHGMWRHSWHSGHRGWWWVVDRFWFFYPAPIYPFPTYIGADTYYDYYDQYGIPTYYWYFCSKPEGYYPYVQECLRPWQPMPPLPDMQ